MSNSPAHVLSRLLHRDDYPFSNWPEAQVNLLKSKIISHIAKCQHSKCKAVRDEMWD